MRRGRRNSRERCARHDQVKEVKRREQYLRPKGTELGVLGPATDEKPEEAG